MKIRDRIALLFALIVGSILLVFSGIIYFIASEYRQKEFYERLRQKARTTVRFLVEVKEVDATLLKIIDRNTLTALFEEKVLIFNEKNRLIYSSIDDEEIHYQPLLLEQVRSRGYVETTDGDNELVGLQYQRGGQELVVLASAYDKSGQLNLQNLRRTLLWGLLTGLILTLALSFLFAGQSLRPIAHINQQVQTITARNLRQRLDEGNRRDELGQLAANFNAVLQRLEQAFNQQRTFVSHASHELRTPLTAMKSEIQLGLRSRMQPEQYEQILNELLGDTDRLIGLTNSLLYLARTVENLAQMAQTPIRLEEVVFAAQEELITARPQYVIDISYENMPQTETETLVKGNDILLKRVFMNLMDNACKYAGDQTARVRIRTDGRTCSVIVTDQGIGIDASELPHIFEPFFRAANASGYEGYGVGLAICRQIIELHQGAIDVVSELGKGCTFTVRLPSASAF